MMNAALRKNWPGKKQSCIIFAEVLGERLFFCKVVHTIEKDGLASICMEVVAVDLAQELEEAKCQWHNMQSVYNEVSDPALIDAVIYQVMAAERRYEYLLRLAKAESLSCENIPVR